jgi:peptidoglycan hydrolase-like protein with peptidoglycan-binding domain
MLKEFGFFEGELNGFFGPETEKAVKDFQESSTNLKANGIIDE